MIFLGIKNIINNCKQATLFILKKKEGKLSTSENLSLIIHLLFCNPCKQFVKQSEIIDHSLHNCKENLLHQPIYRLPEVARKKIQQELDSIA